MKGQSALEHGCIYIETSSRWQLMVTLKFISSTDFLFFLSGAINQLTKNLACEWASDNIRTNTVAPWGVKTTISRNVFMPTLPSNNPPPPPYLVR